MSRFEEGQTVHVWFAAANCYGRKGVRRGHYALFEDKFRVYYDSGALFLTEEEFAMFEVMRV